MDHTEFDALLLEELLPVFCNYYGYDTAGFRPASLNRISDYDATWFLEALATGTVIHDQAFFHSALSGAKEQIFWQGRKTTSPRPITVWAEPIITIGAAGRLYSEFGWPRDLIGLQSKEDWAFDLVAYNRAKEPLMVCEVKKSNREIDDLISAVISYLSQSPLNEEPKQQKLRNAYRKVVGLRKMSPQYFWALGPDNYGNVFRFIFDVNTHTARLEEVDKNALKYQTEGC